MTFLDYEEPKSPPILCKFIPSSLKDAFAQFYAFYFRRRSSLNAKEESPASDIEDERVVLIVVAAVVFSSLFAIWVQLETDLKTKTL